MRAPTVIAALVLLSGCLGGVPDACDVEEIAGSQEFAPEFDALGSESHVGELGIWAKHRDQVKAMMGHAFTSYMENAWPMDELRPLTCTGRSWKERTRGTIDDVLGGYSLTLVDSLDTLAVMGMYDEFYDAVQRVIKTVHFDRDVTVSVFEVTIRVLGGLLSAHLLLVGENSIEPPPADAPPYEDELLFLAEDLGKRLLPAFQTGTGVPYHRINLKHGVETSETKTTCAAAGGTLLFEFGLLSRLTGNDVFEQVARTAVMALWERRSKVTNLVGNTFDVESGRWLSAYTGTGAGVDSFYEYLYKAFILLDSPQSPWFRPRSDQNELKRIFTQAMASADKHLSFGPWHLEVVRDRGRNSLRNFQVSALQAFWPGLQALAGDTKAARESYDNFLHIWEQYGAMPEVFDVASRSVPAHGRHYFLRPELVESTMILYQHTRDPKYLKVGEKLMNDIETHCRVQCGYATVRDVTQMDAADRHEDRMDSFFLAETLKYLFLLFDMGARNSSQVTALAGANKDVMFSTEGHIVFVNSPAAGDTKENLLTLSTDGDTESALRQYQPVDTKLIEGTASVEVLLTPYLNAELQDPGFATTKLSKTFTFSSSEFGAQRFQVELRGKTGLVMIEAEPSDACSSLKNIEAINEAARTTASLRRTDGGILRLAVLVERGRCSFAQKFENIAKFTIASIVLVINNEASSSDRVLRMLDDGSAHSESPALSRIVALSAPNSFGNLVRKFGVSSAGLPSSRTAHAVYHLVVWFDLGDDTYHARFNEGLEESHIGWTFLSSTLSSLSLDWEDLTYGGFVLLISKIFNHLFGSR